jgi:hypothetical protein
VVLADWLLAQEVVADAVTVLERAAVVAERLTSIDRTYATNEIDVLNNLAAALTKAERAAEAVDVARRALHVLDAADAHDEGAAALAFLTAVSAVTLATALLRSGTAEEVIEQARAATAAMRHVMDVDPATYRDAVVEASRALADVLDEGGHGEEAQAERRRAVAWSDAEQDR